MDNRPDIVIAVDQPFSFQAVIYSHGWADLLPFRLNKEFMELRYSFALSSGKTVDIVCSSNQNQINVKVLQELTTIEMVECKKSILRIFRLDENYEDFYQHIRGYPDLRWILEKNAGRLLRCASIWEDMVKVLCTTNCSWQLTKQMIRNLITRVGNGVVFPSPQTVLNYSEAFFRKKVKLGYRSPYLLELAEVIVTEKIRLRKWEAPEISTQHIFDEIKELKGFGEYATASVLKLLGRYDYLGIDSWGRKKFAELYNHGVTLPDKQIVSFYSKFERWSGLVYWLDLTRDIYKSNHV